MNLQSLLKVAKTFGTSLSDLLNGLGEYPEVSLTEIQKKRVVQRSSVGGSRRKRV